MRSLPSWAIGLIFIGVFSALIGVGSLFVNPAPVIVSGAVELDPELGNYAKGIRTLYMVIYQEGAPRPYGAIRYRLNSDAEGRFHSFILTPDNLQVMGATEGGLSGTLRVKARLDTSGMAGPDKEGDLTGEVTGVAINERNLVIKINKRVVL